MPLYRVLVVDDYPDAADVTCTLVRLMGHSARAVVSGAAALEAIGEFAPDVIILDIGLPDVSGLEVAATVRRTTTGARPYIAAVSGWGNPEDRRRALEAGCDLHVLKPTDRAKLQQIFDIVDGSGLGTGKT